jgi:hypothetical protein
VSVNHDLSGFFSSSYELEESSQSSCGSQTQNRCVTHDIVPNGGNRSITRYDISGFFSSSDENSLSSQTLSVSPKRHDNISLSKPCHQEDVGAFDMDDFDIMNFSVDGEEVIDHTTNDVPLTVPLTVYAKTSKSTVLPHVAMDEDDSLDNESHDDQISGSTSDGTSDSKDSSPRSPESDESLLRQKDSRQQQKMHNKQKNKNNNLKHNHHCNPQKGKWSIFVHERRKMCSR